MRIVVVGAGGVGGYYGGLLARAGHEVVFVARGAHLAALQTTGLQVKSVHGDFTVAPIRATDTPAEAGQADLVILCVKAPDGERVAQAVRPILRPDTLVMPLQNGIDAAERTGAVVGMEHMVGGATWISSAFEAPGVIRQFSEIRRIVVGELDGQISPRMEMIVAAFVNTGATVEVTRNIRGVLWTKLVFIAAISSVGSLTRLEVGDYRDVPETRGLLVELMREVEAVGRASGAALRDDVVEEALAIMDAAAGAIRPSMQIDVVAGRPSELESIIGVIGRRGRTLGVSTPAADMVYAALLPGELEARRRIVVRA